MGGRESATEQQVNFRIESKRLRLLKMMILYQRRNDGLKGKNLKTKVER